MEALEIVHGLLKEEGIEYDPEKEEYYEMETGNKIDVDIQKVVSQYLETLKEFYRSDRLDTLSQSRLNTRTRDSKSRNDVLMAYQDTKS